jgi:hypothetical protein
MMWGDWSEELVSSQALQVVFRNQARLKHFKWAGYIQDLNGRWSDDDYFPHTCILGERPMESRL